MADLMTRHWTWLLGVTELFRCYVLLQGEDVAHLSFSAGAHAKALDFLGQRGIIVAPLSRHSALAHRLQERLAAYAAGSSQVVLPPFLASPFWIAATPFQQRVWTELGRIPYGETRTYGEVAARLGMPKGARPVGQACHANPLALIIPCHRVVAAQCLGGFAGEIEIKQRLLAQEKARREGEPHTTADVEEVLIPPRPA